MIDKRDDIKDQLRRHKNTVAFLGSAYEQLTNKYVNARLDLFKYTKPDFEWSSELLLRLDDLRTKKKKSEINIVDYVHEVDQIFIEINNSQ